MARSGFPELTPTARQKLVEVESFKNFVKDPLPEAQWLIEPLFEQDSMAILWGASGEGKTFVMIDMLMAIALGTAWLGKYPVLQGNAVYAIGESPRGVTRRAAGAARFRGLSDVPGLHFYPGAPQILSPEGLQHFIKQIVSLHPRIVVIDTVARSMTGADENAAKDMGMFVHACSQIQASTGACVMLVHHTAKSRKKGQPPTERGSGALRGAMDTSIGVSMLDGAITLTNYKQKDDGLFSPITIGTEVFTLVPGTEHKKPMTTLVLVPIEETVPVSLLDMPQLAVALLTQHRQPCNKTQWLELLNNEQLKRGLKLTPRPTFFRWPEKLVAEGQVVEHEGLFSIMKLVQNQQVA